MRLAEAEIIAGLQHPKVLVREAVCQYLERSQRTQPDVTRHLIAAIDRYGWRDALQWSHRVTSFELDDSSLRWAIEQLERQDEAGPNADTRGHIAKMASRAPPALVEQYMDRLRKLDVMCERPKTAGKRFRSLMDVLVMRLQLAAIPAEQCVELLHEHCREAVNPYSEIGDSAYKEALLERIAANQALASDVALGWLAKHSESERGNLDNWLIGFGVDLAGRSRLEQAVPLIYNCFHDDWDWYSETVTSALIHIGTPSTSAIVADNYAAAADHVRIYSWGILEAIHHDDSVAEIQRLLPYEEDDFNRGQLGVALASHFDTRGVEPALEIYRESPEDCECEAIIARLFAHACLAELDLPEMDAWEVQLTAKWEQFRERIRRMEGRLEYLTATVQAEKEAWRLDVPDEEPLAPSWKPQPIHRKSIRIGRNERCPCGSGKKYKNCCLKRISD